MAGASLGLNLKHDFPAFISREFLHIMLDPVNPLAARSVARHFDQADHLEDTGGIRVHLESHLTREQHIIYLHDNRLGGKFL